MYFICLFVPAVLSTSLDYKICSKSPTNKEYIIKYIHYLFFINLIMNSILFILAENKMILYSSNMFTYSFTFKYMWIVLIISTIIPYLNHIVRKKMNIQIRISKADEK